MRALPLTCALEDVWPTGLALLSKPYISPVCKSEVTGSTSMTMWSRVPSLQLSGLPFTGLPYSSTNRPLCVYQVFVFRRSLRLSSSHIRQGHGVPRLISKPLAELCFLSLCPPLTGRHYTAAFQLLTPDALLTSLPPSPFMTAQPSAICSKFSFWRHQPHVAHAYPGSCPACSSWQFCAASFSFTWARFERTMRASRTNNHVPDAPTTRCHGCTPDQPAEYVPADHRGQ